MIYLRILLTHLRKDIRLEWRDRSALNGMLFFALLIVTVFGLAFDPAGYPTSARQISGGLLWVGILFAANTALNGAWTREVRNGVLDAHRLSPVPPSALFLGKTISLFLFVSIVELVLAPVFAIFYNLHPIGQTATLLLVLPLGTWALVSIGTFFAAMGLRTRNRELLLPLVLCPLAMPALLAMIQATTGVLTGDAEPWLWIRMLLVYDIIFTTVSLLLFPMLLHSE